MNLDRTVSFTDLDQGREILNKFSMPKSMKHSVGNDGSEMINFDLILTTFEASFIFEAAGAVVKIGLSLKSNHHLQI